MRFANEEDEFADMEVDKTLSCFEGWVGILPTCGVGDDEFVLLDPEEPGSPPLTPFDGLSNIACNLGCNIFFI